MRRIAGTTCCRVNASLADGLRPVKKDSWQRSGLSPPPPPSRSSGLAVCNRQHRTASSTITAAAIDKKQWSPKRGQWSPRAHNPRKFAREYDETLSRPSVDCQQHPILADGAPTGTPSYQLHLAAALPKSQTVAQHLQDLRVSMPQTAWIRVDAVPPLSSLDAMLDGLHHALHVAHEHNTLLDLDAMWDGQDAELLPPTLAKVPTRDAIVHQAHVTLSNFGRPNGWYLHLSSRSLALAVRHAPQVLCAWKRVHISSADDYAGSHNNSATATIHDISDATVRVENCDGATAFAIVNLFSRYDLRRTNAIVEWHDGTNSHDNGRMKRPPRTFLVHFASAAWARAALREKQGVSLHGKPIRLAPFPQQII